MAYTVIPAGDIVAGKPTKEEIFDQIRTNQESFNTDIEALKQTSILPVFDLTVVGGLNSYSVSELSSLAPVFKAPASATFTSGASVVGFEMTLLEASSSGTLSMNLDKSTNDGVSWTPLLSADLQLTGTTVGSKSGTVNWVDVPSQSFAQGDMLRVRITGVQTGQGKFHISIYAELA